MFDLSWTEILVIVVVALIAIGPKELPRVLYELGKWVRRARMMAGEFQRHFTDMMHEAELDELRRQAKAAREATGSRSLAELVDPGGEMRHSLDPMSLDPTVTGAAGHAGSPPDAEPVVAAEPPPAEVPAVDSAGEPAAQDPVSPPPVTQGPVG